MIWFIKESLIYSPVHGCGHGSSYMTRPCLAGTKCTPAWLRARGGGSEPRSNRHDIMQSDCTLFSGGEANWSVWRECNFSTFFWAILYLARRFLIITAYFCDGCTYSPTVFAWFKRTFSMQRAKKCVHPISCSSTSLIWVMIERLSLFSAD